MALSVRQLLRRGSIYTIGTGAQLLSGLLILPIVTRLLSPEQYGGLALALVVLQLLQFVLSAGLPSAITLVYFGENGPNRARSLLLATAGIAVLGAAALDAGGPYWSRLFSELEYGPVLRIAVWATVPFVVIYAVQAYLKAADQALRFTVIAVLTTIGAQGLGLAAAVVGETTATSYLAGMAVGYVGTAVVAVALVPPRLAQLRLRGVLSGALAVGLPTVPHGLAAYVMTAGDRVVIEQVEGLEAVARYNVAYLIGTIGFFLVLSLNGRWAPMIYGAPEEERWRLLADTSATVTRLAALVCGGIAIGAPLALRVAAPASYDPASLTPVVAIVAGTLMLLVLYLSNVHITFQQRRTGILAWAAPVAAVFNIGLNVVLVPVMSLTGAAVATLLAYWLFALLLQRRGSQLADVPWDHGQTRRAWVVAAALVAAGALAPTGGYWLAARLVAGLALLGVFGNEVRKLVR